MENLIIVQKFQVQLERLGYSRTSIYMLPRCVKEFLEVQTISQIELITSADIVRHHEYLQTRPNKLRPGGLSESHINHHIYALKTFFKWLEAIGAMQINPISGLEFPSPKTKPREILSQDEIKALYDQCETCRERAVLSVYYGCGLRRTEGIKLDLKDIHFRTGLLYVREGKGAKRRVVPMSRRVAGDLKEYVYRERKARQGETALLTGRNGNRINENTTSKTLKTLLEKAEITRETEGSPTPLKSFTGRQITLHSLRHSIATHLLESGMSLEDVREFLGHSHLESTQIYTRISKKQLGKL